MGVTADLARLALAVPGRCGDATRARARLCLLDCVAVTVAGSTAREVGALRDLAAAEGGKPVATLIGTGLRASPRQAALVNGTASHFHDYDDIHLDVPGHATAPVASALWGLAEAREATGRQVLHALAAGVEVACRLGRVLQPGHYDAGWHASATLGALSSAAACAVLIGLPPERVEAAVCLAASMASGLRGAFGAAGKPFQIGHAAANGVLAAEMAERGFGTQPGMLERRDGFLAAYAPGAAPDAVRLIAEWEGSAADGATGLAIDRTAFKRHAACFLTHAAMDAARLVGHRMAGGGRLRAGAVRSLRVRGSADLCAVCDRPRLGTELDSKFSVQFAVAATLAGLDTAAPSLFERPPSAHAGLSDMMGRISVAPDPRMAHGEAELLLELEDGTVVAQAGTAGVPEPDLDVERGFVAAKAEAVCLPVLGAARTGRLVAAILGMDDDGRRRLPDLAALAADGDRPAFSEEAQHGA